MDELPSDEEIGQRLKAARALRGITNAEEFAAELRRNYKVAEIAYAEYESGKRTLQGRDRLAVKEALGIPEWWLTAPLESLLPPEPATNLAELVLHELQSQVDESILRLEERIAKLLESPNRESGSGSGTGPAAAMIQQEEPSPER